MSAAQWLIRAIEAGKLGARVVVPHRDWLYDDARVAESYRAAVWRTAIREAAK